MSFFLRTGELHAPYFVFFRSPIPTCDRELLDSLGLREHKPQDIENPGAVKHRPYSIVGNTKDWTVISDDWSYNIWHSENRDKIVTKFASGFEYEVFSYRVPDVDDTFEFHYWQEGRLIRSYSLFQKNLSHPPSLTESGSPFSFETETLCNGSATKQIQLIAKNLGFDVSEAKGSFRCYAGEEKHTEMPTYDSVITNISRADWEKARRRGNNKL